MWLVLQAKEKDLESFSHTLFMKILLLVIANPYHSKYYLRLEAWGVLGMVCFCFVVGITDIYLVLKTRLLTWCQSSRGNGKVVSGAPQDNLLLGEDSALMVQDTHQQ